MRDQRRSENTLNRPSSATPAPREVYVFPHPFHQHHLVMAYPHPCISDWSEWLNESTQELDSFLLPLQ
ncbi:unnamed protein product [Haemonchus placei]|uniref:Uncharacterized protein n=1 Tax=Haemonchus placei TaxID=6290 RepID=A0A0N4W1J7_HAEPC|nr:unnamed protein product [Haemonchus placei]